MKKKGGKKNPISGLEPIIIFPLFFDCFLLVFRNVKTKEARDEDKKKTNTFDWTPHTHIFMISMGPGIWLEFKAASFPISFRWIPRWKRNSFYPSNDVFISIFFVVLFYRFASSCQRRFRQFPSAVDALVGSSALVLRHPFPASAASSSATAATAAATATVVQQRSRHVASARANPRSAAAPSPFGDSRIAGQRSPPPVPSPPQRRPFVGHGRTAIRRRTQRSNLRHPGPFDGQPNLQRRRKPQRRRRQLLFRAVQPGRRRRRRRRLFRPVGTRVASQAEEDEKATQSRRSRRMPIRQKEKQRRYTTRFV